MTFDEELGPQLAALEGQARSLDGLPLASNLEQRAWILVTLQRLEEALDLLEQQDEILGAGGHDRARPACWRDQAEVLRGLGRNEEALLMLDRYEAASASGGDSDAVGYARACRSAILEEQAAVPVSPGPVPKVPGR